MYLSIDMLFIGRIMNISIILKGIEKGEKEKNNQKVKEAKKNELLI